jgi:hypothetical protein
VALNITDVQPSIALPLIHGAEETAPPSKDTIKAIGRSSGMGSLAQLPATEYVAPFNNDERKERWSAADKYHFNAPNADRWMYLERMRINLINGPYKSVPSKLEINVGKLQQELETTSEQLATSNKHLGSLEKNGWHHVPFTKESNDYASTKNKIFELTGKLNSLGAKIDKLLNKDDSIDYMRPIKGMHTNRFDDFKQPSWS